MMFGALICNHSFFKTGRKSYRTVQWQLAKDAGEDANKIWTINRSYTSVYEVHCILALLLLL